MYGEPDKQGVSAQRCVKLFSWSWRAFDGKLDFGRRSPSFPQSIGSAANAAEPFERDDGLHPNGRYDPSPRYDSCLRALGYEASNPWSIGPFPPPASTARR